MTDPHDLLARMASQPPHIADCTRRGFIRNAGLFGLSAAAAAAMTRQFAFTPALAATPPELPAMTSIPANLKGSGVVRVCSYGGAFQDAQRKAYFKPFQELSGIRVIESEGPDPAKVKAMVDVKNPEYDVTEMEGADVVNLARKGDYWEPIDYSLFDTANIDKAFRSKLYFAMLPYAQIIAFRRDGFKGTMPASTDDLWNRKGFPGPRSLQSGASGTQADLELAVMADGVAPDKVYPIDLDRAFKSLGRIKPDVVKWWTAGAQPAQLLNDNEVVLATAWNGRIAAIQATGAPVDIIWKNQLLRTDVWAIPHGAANASNAQKLCAFITLPISQARLSMLIPYGFVNDKAADHIPPADLAVLPTAPAIKSQLINYDSPWWAAHADEVVARWNKFVLG